MARANLNKKKNYEVRSEKGVSIDAAFMPPKYAL